MKAQTSAQDWLPNLAEAGDVADVGGGQGFGDAEDDTADHGAVDVADAAEHGAVKAFRPRMKPILKSTWPYSRP